MAFLFLPEITLCVLTAVLLAATLVPNGIKEKTAHGIMLTGSLAVLATSVSSLGMAGEIFFGLFPQVFLDLVSVSTNSLLGR